MSISQNYGSHVEKVVKGEGEFKTLCDVQLV